MRKEQKSKYFISLNEQREEVIKKPEVLIFSDKFDLL